MNPKFEAWWDSLPVYQHDPAFRLFPVGQHGDGLAVGKTIMRSIWDSMVPFWDAAQAEQKAGIDI